MRVEGTTKSNTYFSNSGQNDPLLLRIGSIRFVRRAAPAESSLDEKIGPAMHDLDPEFERFSRDPRLHDLLRELGIAQPRVYQSMNIFRSIFLNG